MGTIESLTKARMLNIEATTVVSGLVDANGRLILYSRDGASIDAGNVVGPQPPIATNAETLAGTLSTKAVAPTGLAVALAALVPAGTISMFAGGTAPATYALCQGQALSRVTNSVLFAAIGITYGVGDGSTTFNVPNIRGRVPVGLDAAQTEFNALGKIGGAKNHTLVVAEMPPHKHPMTMGASNGTGSNRFAQANAPTSLIAETDIGSTGGGLPHNNLPPYLTINYIIKT